MVIEINPAFWRVVQEDETIAGWVRVVPSRQGFSYRAYRIGPRGLGMRLGDYDTVDAAAAALLR